MATVKGVMGRLRGDRMTALIHQTAALSAELAALRSQNSALTDQVAALHDQVAALHDQAAALHDQAVEQGERLSAVNHSVLSMNHNVERTAELTAAHHTVLLELNHDVRAGSERALPLFLGYTERLRLDTDTAIGAAQVIERQLALLEDLVAASDEPAST